MTWPNLPTDNLYKFMAIFGFVAFVLAFGASEYVLTSATFINSEVEVFQKHSDDVQKIKAKTSDALNSMEAAREDTEKNLLSTLIQLKSTITTDALSQLASAYESAADRIKQNAATALSDYEQFSTDALSIDLDLAKEGAMLKAFDRYEPSLEIIGAGSAVISITGFALWYFNLQRYQDRILSEEAAGQRPRRLSRPGLNDRRREALKRKRGPKH